MRVWWLVLIVCDFFVEVKRYVGLLRQMGSLGLGVVLYVYERICAIDAWKGNK